MTPHAVIFDVYRTLLEVGEAPADADFRWQRLYEDFTGSPPVLSRPEFVRATDQVVARHHARARACGIPWPEVVWPAVVAEVLPGLSGLAPAAFHDFVFRNSQIDRSLRLADGAAECLCWLRDRGVLLGIASNAQAYTLRELKEALCAVGLDPSLFDPSLCFWSFEHGFSKPDPHVFQILASRMEARGMERSRLLMVGDRLDNDIVPARSHGWKAWHLTTNPASAGDSGNFSALLSALGGGR